MIIRKYILILTIILLTGFLTQIHGQRWKLMRYEACLGLGTSHFFGDIVSTPRESNFYGLKDLRLNETRPSAFLGLRYKFLKNVSGRFNLIYGNVTSSDIESQNLSGNLSFSASLIETSVQGEYYFIPEIPRLKRTSSLLHKGRPNNFNTFNAYIFGGVGSLLYFPQLNGDLSLRKPDEYEGYNNITLTIPVGFGLKYSLNQSWALGLEIGGRWNASDFVDGFKSKANANNSNDIFYFTSIQAVHKIKNDRSNVPVFLKKRGYGASSTKKKKPEKYKRPKPPKPPHKNFFLFFWL